MWMASAGLAGTPVLVAIDLDRGDSRDRWTAVMDDKGGDPR